MSQHISKPSDGLLSDKQVATGTPASKPFTQHLPKSDETGSEPRTASPDLTPPGAPAGGGADPCPKCRINRNSPFPCDCGPVDVDVREVLKFYAKEWQLNGEGDTETPGLFKSWMEPTDALQNDEGRKAREALRALSTSPKPQPATVTTQLNDGDGPR